MKSDMILFWVVVSFYGISTFSYIFGLISRYDKLFSVGLGSALAGFIPHVIFIALRWMKTGVTPFIAISESITLGVFMAVLIFLIAQFSSKKIPQLGVLVMPVVFVLMGWAGTLFKEVAASLAPALQSFWIWIHITGASIGFASVLIAAALSLLYLLREKKTGGMYEKLPDLKYLDILAYRYISAGFIMYGIMIISGAYWSNQVKGNYWAWDPVEVWSLVTWLTYGIYLHLRITMGWRGQRLAIYAMVALAVMIVSYWGIPFSVETFHTGFRIDHN